MKTILITGATAGIGEAIARVFARANYRVILNGRRTDRLAALQSELERDFGASVLSLAFDVRDNDAIRKALNSLDDTWKQIDILVNNAGLALGRAPIHEGNPADWDTVIDTNIKGVLYMTRAISPQMVERKSGHIINIGSIAGKDTYRDGNVYCLTKHAVDTLTKATRIDLLEHGVRVTQISPGIAETEFLEVRHKGDSAKAAEIYARQSTLRAADVAETVYFAATRPPHVNINDLVVTHSAQANSFYSDKK